MRDKMYDELALERAIKANFGVNTDISQSIAYKIPVGPTAEATLFLTTQKQLFLYVNGQSKLLLGDIKKITSRVGLKADTYFPPKNRSDYFNEIGRKKFSEVFPGRKFISEDDVRFYKTLVPYNPALVLISEVKDGHIYQYDSDSNTKWRPSVKFSYRRIRTS